MLSESPFLGQDSEIETYLLYHITLSLEFVILHISIISEGASFFFFFHNIKRFPILALDLVHSLYFAYLKVMHRELN